MSTVFEDHFYHKTFALYSAVFGSCFNDIKIKRSNGELIKIPIAYSVKQKYSVRNEQNEDPNEARYAGQLPRMGFRMTGFNRDSDRATNKFTQLQSKDVVDKTTVDSIPTQRNRVPYLFNFELNVKTKNIDDMMQILEQIVVWFNPTLRVTVLDNPDLDSTSSITIKLLQADKDELFEGSFDTSNIYEATLQFTLEGWLMMPTQNSKIIKKIQVNYFDLSFGNLIDQEIITP